MARHFIHSTVSQNLTYPIWSEGEGKKGASSRMLDAITIAGNKGVMDERSLFIGDGLVTEVSDEELARLMKNSLFQKKIAEGFYTVKTYHTLDTSDMEKRDRSVQVVDEEFADGTDPRIPDSGQSFAEAGRNNRWRGKKGRQFRSMDI